MNLLTGLLTLGLASTVMATPSDLSGIALESILNPSAGSLWKSSGDEFMARHPELGFGWVSASKETARSVRPGLRFCGMPVYEAILRFAAGQPNELVASLYNRGDAGNLEEAEFQKFMANVDERLTAWAGAKGTTLKTQDRTAIAAIRKKSWVKEPHRIDLVWSFSEKSRSHGVAVPRPEYARLQIFPFDPSQDPRKSILVGSTGRPRPVSVLELRSRLKREPNGDVYLPGVPMVDQGKKGYCAAAVAERVLRYYGRNLDQHEIAQLANTTAGGGTNPDQMVAALRRIGDETKLDINVLQDFDFRDYEKTVQDYNRAAKRAGKPEIEYLQRSGNTIMLRSPTAVYQQMEADLLREARVKRDAGLQSFRTTIHKYINNGAPLAWGCIVGKVKETPTPQGFGGHMRLIIGYNDRTQEILYTDTWGPGHDLKRMPLHDAWTVTLGLYSIQPRDVRF